MIFKYSKNIMMAALLLAAAAIPVSCKNTEVVDDDDMEEDTSAVETGLGLNILNGGNDFRPLSEGLSYKVEKANPKGRQVQLGDVLVGEITVRFEDSVMFDNKGKPDRIAIANPISDPLIGKELTRMHVGEIATFAIEADVMVSYLGSSSMPPFYHPGTGQKIYYTINLQDIVTSEELQKEQALYTMDLEQMQQKEPEEIRKFIQRNNIKTKPTADGLYIVMKKKGNGAKVTSGKQVTVHYTGRLLDGTKFDSSVDRGEPFTFQIGVGQVIQGWDKGLLGQTVGSKLQLIIPSSMAYGSAGAGGLIPPYSSLAFDVEIISVK